MKERDSLPYKNILIVEAHQRAGVSIALIREGKISKISETNSQAQELPVMIDTLLSKCRFLPSSLDALGLVKCEGSVTAIRITTATINTLSYLHKLPIIEIEAETLENAIKKLSLGEFESVVQVSQPLS